jgi:calcineurin-like phosphoesterase family protein
MPALPRRARLLALALLLAVGAGLVLSVVVRRGNAAPSPTPRPSVVLPSPSPNADVLLGVGDIGSCDGKADEAVAELAATLPGTIALLGDTAYESGTTQEFADCFEPAWGPMRSRLRPAAGNHDYETADAAGYFAWFGSAAGTPGEGWYSYEIGSWHVVVLNSNCQLVGGCGKGSPQLTWLASDLAGHPTDCLLAYWHHPRWSSGRHGSSDATQPLWAALAAAGADVILSGHDHNYERILVDGVREFVVGTGGRSLYQFGRDPLDTTEVRSDEGYGLLELTLGEGRYDWQFLTVDIVTTSFTDSGTGECG